MQDHVTPRRRLDDGLGVQQVGGDQAHLGDVRQVLVCISLGEVVEADHLVALGDQPPAQVRSDETGGAGHEAPHSRTTFERRPRVTPRVSTTSGA